MKKFEFVVEKVYRSDSIYRVGNVETEGGLWVSRDNIGNEIQRIIDIYDKEYGKNNYEINFTIK